MPLGYPQGRQGLAAFRSTFLMVSRVIFLKQICHQLSPLIKISHRPFTASKIESNSFAWHRRTLLSLLLLFFSCSISCSLPHYHFYSSKAHLFVIPPSRCLHTQTHHSLQVFLSLSYSSLYFLCSHHPQCLLISYPVSLCYNSFILCFPYSEYMRLKI